MLRRQNNTVTLGLSLKDYIVGNVRSLGEHFAYRRGGDHDTS